MFLLQCFVNFQIDLVEFHKYVVKISCVFLLFRFGLDNFYIEADDFLRIPFVSKVESKFSSVFSIHKNASRT